MSRFCSLSSSSKGNSTYLSGGGTAVLVDAGISYRALSQGLYAQGLMAEDIRAVLVTHEHSDHIRGLHTLLKKRGVPVYGSSGTLSYLCDHGHIPPGTELVECTGTVVIGDLAVSAFPIPHDACDPTGFRIIMPDGRSVAIATDLGHVTEAVRAGVSGCDLVMLESNYDPGMLDCSRYPYYLKRRIKSAMGHLSNNDCAQELIRLVRTGTTRLVLGHLSEENNLPALAYETGKSALGAASMRENDDYILKIAPARAPREVLVF